MLHGNMTGSVDAIPLTNLSLSLLPALVVLAILHRWSAGAGAALYGIGRMVAQLALVGYVTDVHLRHEPPGGRVSAR